MAELKTVAGSSQVAAIGHDPATRTLSVRFHNGGTYHYEDVPPTVAEAVIGADSVGAALHRHVKNGNYRFRKD